MQSTSNRRLTKSVLIGTSMFAGLALAGAAYAQPASGSAGDASSAVKSGATEVGAVVVTGSRIARRDFTSNSPIVTVSSQQFEQSSNVAIEHTLNKLPQFTPAQDLTGVNSGDVQPTADNTVGISTASLRGLGSNRNLVLADGQRLQPVNGSLVIDLNSIPSAIIDHVEVVTGGASAVYGADAISGVVNFILKKNFEGLTTDLQWGETQQGDGREFKASVLFGTNFADDRGNVTVGLERYTRAPSYQKNHDFFVRGFGDRTTATNEFFNTGTYFFGPNDPPTGAAVSAATGAPFGAFNGFGFFRVNFGNGSVSAGTFGNPGALGGIYNYTGPIDGLHVANEDFVAPNGSIEHGIKTNQVDKYFITSPLNRWSMYAAAHYDITDDLTAYIRGTFATTHTATNLFSTPFIGGWSVDLPYNKLTDDPASPGFIPTGSPGAQHPVTSGIATLLNNQLFLPPGTPAATWTPWIIPTTNAGGWALPRSTIDDNTVWQFTAGLKGKLPFQDWTWEAYGSHGQASDYTAGYGDVSLQRFIAVLSSPDYGRNTDFIGNQIFGHGGFGVAHAHCTSGFYGAIYQGTRPSQDCLDAINAIIQSRVLEEQNIVEFDTQGTLFALPAGDLKLSLGADYREEHVQYTPDILQSTVSFIDQVAGVYPTSYVNGSTQAKEVYGELFVPILKDLPGVMEFNLELGARYSTYTGHDLNSGLRNKPPGGWTYKALGDWKITDWMRLRGGYNLAVRSPNVGELFLPIQQVFAGSTAYGDPCTTRSTAPFGAGGADLGFGPGVDPNNIAGTSGANNYKVFNSGGLAGAQNALNICKALMGSAGAASYYGGNTQVQIAAAPAPFGFERQLGNSNLDSEKAHTWTAGAVFSSPFQNPWLGGAHLSVDYYNIKINGAIELQAVDEVKAGCYGQAAAPAAAAASAACQLVSRFVGTGAEDTTTVQFRNEATIWTSGLDFEFDDSWNFEDIGLSGVPGRLQFNWLFNYLLKYDTQASKVPGFDGIFHWAGTLGPSLNGVQPGSAYRYKMNTTLTYMEGPLSLSLNWRYVPHTHSAQLPVVASTFNKNAPDPSKTGVGSCNVTVACTLDTKAYHTFDLSGTYTIMRNYTLRAGVDNLFDKDPPTTSATTGIGRNPDGTYKAGGTLASDGIGGFGSGTNASLYDALGRRFYIGLTAKF